MKSKLINFLVFFFLCVPFTQGQDGVAVVSGKWERALRSGTPLRLYMVADGNFVEVASSSITADNMFYFACKPEPEGFYYIGVNPQPTNRFTIYLKRGDRLDMTITSNSWHFNGNVSVENRELKKWHEFVETIEQRAIYFQRFNSTFRDFFPALEEKYEELKKYPSSNTGNKIFDRKFDSYKKLDFTAMALAYMFAPRGVHPKAEDFPKYYHNLEIPDFAKTTELMNYPAGVNMIDRILFVKGMATGTPTRDPATIIMENIDSLIPNDTIKGELTVRFAANRFQVSRHQW